MLKKFNWAVFLSGILSIVLGLYILLNPMVGLASFTVLFGVVILTHGISELIVYFKNDYKYGWKLFSSILTMLVGLSILGDTFFQKVVFIPYLIAFWAMVSSFTKLMMSFQVRSEDKKLGNILLILGILGVLLSIFLMGHPLFLGSFVIYGISCVLIFEGISSVVSALNSR